MKIYLAHPMSGLNFKDIEQYYTNTVNKLKGMGYTTLTPMSGKVLTTAKGDCKPYGYSDPIITDRAILSRDRWMVCQSDIVLMDLSGATEKSLGCIAETAFAYVDGAHIVMVMEKDNVHRHAFMHQMANIIFETYDEAIEYLKVLIDSM